MTRPDLLRALAGFLIGALASLLVAHCFALAAEAIVTGDVIEVPAVEPSEWWDFDIGPLGDQYQRTHNELEWGAKFAGEGEECLFAIAENDAVLTGALNGTPTAPLVPLELTEQIFAPSTPGRAYHVDAGAFPSAYILGGVWGCGNWATGEPRPAGFGDGPLAMRLGRVAESMCLRMVFEAQTSNDQPPASSEYHLTLWDALAQPIGDVDFAMDGPMVDQLGKYWWQDFCFESTGEAIKGWSGYPENAIGVYWAEVTVPEPDAALAMFAGVLGLAVLRSVQR